MIPTMQQQDASNAASAGQRLMLVSSRLVMVAFDAARSLRLWQS